MKTTTFITFLILGLFTLQTLVLRHVVINRVPVTQPTEIKMVDLPEEFSIATDYDEFIAYKRNDTLFVRFSTKQYNYRYEKADKLIPQDNR